MCDVAILAQAKVRKSITIVTFHCGFSAMSISVADGVKTYGPLAVFGDESYLSPEQTKFVREKGEIQAVITSRESWGGICLGSTCRRQCRHAVSDRPCSSA